MATSTYSIEGLKLAWKTEYAFRQEVLVPIPAILVTVMLPVSDLKKPVLRSF